MLQLSSVQRRELRARAHNLDPVVSIAENGLTDDDALKAGMDEKSREFAESGAEVYTKA